MNNSLDLKSLRSRFGLSQVRLSQESGISLPTIQNIEGDRANPSWETAQKLLSVFGLALAVSPMSPDWPTLQACGLPVMVADGNARLVPSRLALVREMRKLVAQTLSERETDAAQALLIALRDHYPSVFGESFDQPAFHRFLERDDSPRLIKLRRLALAKLGAYL